MKTVLQELVEAISDLEERCGDGTFFDAPTLFTSEASNRWTRLNSAIKKAKQYLSLPATDRDVRTIRDWQNLVRENSIAHGFATQTVPESCALLHSEVSELFEAYRKQSLGLPCDKSASLTNAEEELADIVIRALDTAAKMGIDMERAVELKHTYNTTRVYKHGQKIL